jgi:hypothetical protein
VLSAAGAYPAVQPAGARHGDATCR